MGLDLTFNTECGRFNYRVGAIIIHDGKVLMVKHNNSPFYYTVGGRVKLHESSAEAILREAKEETGVDFEIDRLGFIEEVFYVEDGEKHHEMSVFYYLKTPLEIRSVKKCFDANGLERTDIELVWLPLNGLNKFNLYPDFFKTQLTTSSPNVKHIVSKRYN